MSGHETPPDPTDAPGESVPRVERLASVIRRGTEMRDLLFLNNIIDSVADPVLVKDHDLRFLLVNQALCEFTGVPRDRFIGRTDADLFPAEQARIFNAMDRLVLETGRPNINEEVHTHADGTIRTIRTTKTKFVDVSGDPVLVGIFTDLTALRATQRELEAANVRLHELAHRDRLTGLPNRMAFEETLAQTVASADRHNETFSVLFMDLNGFKQVNDTYGHGVGDELIRCTAERLAGVARDSDFLARLGGDEFVMIARSTGELDACHVASRLAGAVGRPYHLSAAEVAVSISIGIAGFPADGQDESTLIRCADSAMYRAKRVTGKAFEFHDAAESAAAERRVLLEHQLRLDIERGGIDVHLQPIVRLTDGEVLGFEALARWQHPRLGGIVPDEFIPLAEKTGLIDGLGRIVLRRACEFIVRHGGSGQYVTVNVSGRQLEDAGFVADLRAILAETGAMPAQLALELTESSLSTPGANAALRLVHEAGVLLFIDDFGVGYSNLTRLLHLPIDAIKIDRAFVKALGIGGTGDPMIRAIVAMAAELGLAIIAEGIEQPTQGQILQELGVNVGQGYYYGRPAPIQGWAPAGSVGDDRIRQADG